MGPTALHPSRHGLPPSPSPFPYRLEIAVCLSQNLTEVEHQNRITEDCCLTIDRTTPARNIMRVLNVSVFFFSQAPFEICHLDYENTHACGRVAIVTLRVCDRIENQRYTYMHVRARQYLGAITLRTKY